MPRQDGIPTIDDIRKETSAYDDVNDTQLAQALYLKHEPDEDFESFAQDVGLDREADRATFAPNELRERKENLEEMSSFERGLRGGWEKTKALGAGAVGAVGAAAEETIGVGEGLRDWGISEYQENMQEAQLKYPQETSFKELVQDPSLSGAAEWATYTLGDLAPTIATTLASGGVGGVASGAIKAGGRKALETMSKKLGTEAIERGVKEAGQKLVNRQLAKGVAEKSAEKLVTRGIGAQAGLVASSGALETGGMYGEAAQKLGAEEANPFKAMALGGAAGALELAGGNIRVLKKLFGDKIDEGVRSAIELAQRSSKARPAAMQYLSRVVGEAARQAPAEMGQEATQEALAIANMNWQDPRVQEVLTEENAWQLIEAGAAGGLAGGAMGGVGAATVDTAKSALGMEPNAEQQITDLEQRIERQKVLREKESPEKQAEIDTKIAENQQQIETLKTDVLSKQEGKIAYDEAAKRLDQEAPQPDGKKTTTRSVRKLVKKGKIAGDKFGVDEASLTKHVSERQIDQIDENKDVSEQAEQVLNIAQKQDGVTDSVKKKGEKLIEPLSKEIIKTQRRGDKDRYNKLVKTSKSLTSELGIDKGKFDFQRIRKDAEGEFAQESADLQRNKLESQQQPTGDPFANAPDETQYQYSLGEEFQQISNTVDNIVQGKSENPAGDMQRLWDSVYETQTSQDKPAFTSRGFMKAVRDLASSRARYREDIGDRQEAEARAIDALKQWQTKNVADPKIDVSGSDLEVSRLEEGRTQLGKIQGGARYAYIVSGLDYLQEATDKDGNSLAESFVAPKLGVDAETAKEVMEADKQQIIRDTGLWDAEFNQEITEDVSSWREPEKQQLLSEITGFLEKRAEGYQHLKENTTAPKEDYREIVQEFDRAVSKSDPTTGNDPKIELEKIKSDYVQTRAQLKTLEEQGAPKAKGGDQGQASQADLDKRHQTEKQALRNRLYQLTMEAQRDKYMHPRIRKIQPTRVFSDENKKQKNQGQRDKNVFKNRVKWASKALAQKMLSLKLDFERFDEDPLFKVPPPESSPIEYSDGSYRIQSVSNKRLPDRQQLEEDIARLFNSNVFAIDDFQHIIGTPEFMGAVAHQYIDQQAVKENALQPYWTDIIDSAVTRFEELYERSQNTETQDDQQRILGEFSSTLAPLLRNIETKNLVEAISSELLRHNNRDIRSAYRGALQDRKALKDTFANSQRNVDKHIKSAENLAVDFRKHATPTNPGRMNSAELERRRKLYNEGKINSIFPKTNMKEFQSGFREWMILDTLRRSPAYNGAPAGKDQRHPAVRDETRQNLARGMANIQALGVLTDNLSDEEQQLVRNAPVLQSSGPISRSLADKAIEKSELADDAMYNEQEDIRERVDSDINFIKDPKNQEILAQHPREKDQSELFNKLYDIASKAFSRGNVHLQPYPHKIEAGRGTLVPQVGVEDKTRTGGMSYQSYDGDIISMERGGQKYLVLDMDLQGMEDVSLPLTDEDIRRMEELGFEDSVEWELFGSPPDSARWNDALEKYQGYAPTQRIRLRNLSTGKESTISAGTEVYKHPRLDHFFNFRLNENKELRNFYRDALWDAYRYEMEQAKKAGGEDEMYARASLVKDENGNEYLRFMPDRRGVYHEDFQIVEDATVKEWATRDTSQVPAKTAAGIERARQLDKMTRAIEEHGKFPTDLPTLGVDQLAAFEPDVMGSQLSEDSIAASGARGAVAGNVFHGRLGSETSTGEGKGPLEDASQDAMSGRTGQDLSMEEAENEGFRRVEFLTDQKEIDYKKLADELDNISGQMPEQHKPRFELMAHAFRQRAEGQGTKAEADQVERTAAIQNIIKQDRRLNDKQKNRIWAKYKNEGEQAGNKEAVRALVEAEVAKRYGREEAVRLWNLKKNDEEQYKRELEGAMDAMRKKDRSSPEFHTIEPERFEEALVFALADKPLYQKDKDLLKDHLEDTIVSMNNPFNSMDNLEALKKQIDEAEKVGDLLQDSVPFNDNRIQVARQAPASGVDRATGTDMEAAAKAAANAGKGSGEVVRRWPNVEQWGDLHGKNSPLHRAVFDVTDEKGKSVADRKGLLFKVERPVTDKEYRKGKQSDTYWLTARQLENLAEDREKPNRIVGFKTAEKMSDGSLKRYEISITEEAQLTKDEEEAFQDGYHAHITQSAAAKADKQRVKTDRGLEVQIGGKWFMVTPDDTAIKDFHLDDLRQAAKSSQKKAEGNERRPGASWQTEDFVVDDYFLGYSLSDIDEPRVIDENKVNRKQISKNLNDIAEQVTYGSRNVYVHDSPYSPTVPQPVRQQIEKEGVTGFVKGVFDPRSGNAHVFLNRHVDSKGNVDNRSLAKTMLHETVGHGGLSNIFSDNKEYGQFISDVYRTYKSEIGIDPTQMSKPQFLREVEDFISRKIEKTEIVEDKNGRQRFVNPEINTWFDKIATFVVRAARKIGNQFGIRMEMTKPEIRETIAKTFKGLQVKRTHGLGHMIPDKFKPAHSLPTYRNFASYEENVGDWILRKFEDSFRPFVSAKKAMKKQGIELAPGEDVESQLRRYQGRMADKLEPLQKRMRKWTEKLSKKGLTLEDTKKYLWAKSALEKNEKIRKTQSIREQSNLSTPEIEAGASGIDDATANRWIEELRSEGKIDKVHELAQEIWDVNNEFLEYLEFYELASKEEVERMRNTYKHFVPFGADESFETAVQQPGGLTGTTNLVEGLRPNPAPELDPAAMTFTRIQKAIANGEKNLVKQALSRQIYNHPNSDLFELYIPEEGFKQLQEEFGYSDESMNAWMRKTGIHSVQDLSVEGDIKDLVKNKSIIPVRHNGVEHYIRINHDGLRRAFLQEGIVRGGGVVKAFGSLSRWLVMANTMLNPEFLYTNLNRDVGTAVGNITAMHTLGKREDTAKVSKELVKSIPSVMRGIANYKWGDGSHKFAKAFKEFSEYGGKIGHPFLGHRDAAEQVEEFQKQIARVGEGGLAALAKNNKDGLMEFVTNVNDVFENASRVAAYQKAVENGVPKSEAAKMARELTVDFERKGELGQMMNTFYIFSTAGVGGTARIIRGLKDNPQKAGKIMGSIALGGFTMSLMNRLLGGTDDDDNWYFEKLNRDERSRHMVFMMPGTEGEYVKIPLPYGFGFFYDAGQLLADYAMGERGRDEMTTAGMMLGSATHNFNPISAAGKLNTAHGWLQLASPTLADPIVDVSMNKTPFGSPLSPTPEYKGQPDSHRHWDSVGTTSKAAAQWLNEITGGAPEVPGAVDISPETMDYMLETFGGSAGRFWLQRLPGYISSKLSGKKVENYNDVPGIRRVMGEPFDWQNRKLFNEAVYSVQSAADRLDNMRKRLEYAKTESARRDAQETIRQYQKENRDLLTLDELRKQTFDRIKQLDTQKEKIRKSGYDQTKRDKMLSRIDDTQYRLMKRFNSRFLDSVK